MKDMLDKIAEIIKNQENILILPHVSADGDAFGACLALAIALNAAGKKVTVVTEEDIPELYSFLPGKNLVKLKGKLQKGSDLAIAVDTGDTGRLGERLPLFESSKITVNIDHHKTNTEFALHNYIDVNASASGEIIFRLLGILGCRIDAEIALCLYVAIATDTGGFRYSNTLPETHRIAAELIEKGVNVSETSQRVFDSTSYEKVMLMGIAIHSLELHEGGSVAFIALKNEDIRKSGAREEDCEGIVNIARNIRGVKVAAMLRQWDNGDIKVNLRSSSDVDVAAIASMYKGGGHRKAAGFITSGSPDDIKRRLLEDIKEVL